MEFREYLIIVRRRWVVALTTALLVMSSAALLTIVSTPKYTATTRLFFAVQGTESVTDLAQGSNFTEEQMGSYAEVVTSPLVLGPVTDKLGLGVTPEELAPSISTVVPANTVILDVSVTHADPRQATAIANAIGDEARKVVVGLSPEREGGGQAVKATILAPAQVPMAPSSPNVIRNLGMGLVLAVILGVAAALLRNALDTKIRSDHDLRSVTARPVLGAIAFDDAVPTHPVMVADQPLSGPSEAIRRLRTNLQFVESASESKAIVLTSSVPGEGKSTTSINLAVAMDAAGSRTLLIDADLRRPSVAEYLGMEGRAGLTSVLIGRADVSDVIQRWHDSDLHVLTSGPVPPNPSELLGSTAMTKLLRELSEVYDVILLDTPPLLAATDAAVLAKMCDGAVVVVGADRIRRGQLGDSLQTLETAGAPTLGVVLNKVARRDAPSYVYESGYYIKDDEQVAPVEPARAAPQRSVTAS
ncbi:polysaccharide biosynthesis tyrosine autokinase [Propionibacteriaceae bacterium Y1685]|uniref:polysaccharide biosynthesis tyrosine autokinase n=1 Tax=Microlunatus sp. Y1700 TaxID=3418487 RepID=UPI003B81F738